MDGEIISITRKLYIPKAVDTVFNSNQMLMRARKAQKSYDGGTSINPLLEYDELSAGGSFQGLELLDTTVNDIITNAQYEWRQEYVGVGWSTLDYLKNYGSKTKIIDLVSTKTKAASKKMQKMLTTQTFASTKAKSTDLDGWVVAAFAAGTTDCGALDSNDITLWAPQRDTSTTKLTLAAMNTLWRSASDEPESPTSIVTTDAIMGYYYDIATPLQRIGDTESAKMGFTSLSFNGVPLFSDKSAPTGYLFMWNEDHLFLGVHSQCDMKYIEPMKPLNQSAELGRIEWAGNWICDSRRRLGVMTAIAA